jgi:hypothetical protein
MWPFTPTKKREHELRYKAALIVLLGNATYQSLSIERKSQIDFAVSDNFNATDDPTIAWINRIDPDQLAVFRAAAMERLQIQPIVSVLSWSDLFKPWNKARSIFGYLSPDASVVWLAANWRPFDDRADWIFSHYRVFDPATIEAENYLREHGLVTCALKHGRKYSPDEKS